MTLSTGTEVDVQWCGYTSAGHQMICFTVNNPWPINKPILKKPQCKLNI